MQCFSLSLSSNVFGISLPFPVNPPLIIHDIPLEVEQEVQGFPVKRCTFLMKRNILACSPSRIFEENLEYYVMSSQNV